LRISGSAAKEGVELLRLVQPGSTATEAVENARRSIEDALGPALAIIKQALLVRLEGLQQLLTLAQDVAEELFVITELAFQLLELHQQT